MEWLLQHVLKLSTGYTGSGASREVQAKVDYHFCSSWGYKSSLQMAATCARLGGAQLRPSWEMRLSASSTRLGATSERYWAC